MYPSWQWEVETPFRAVEYLVRRLRVSGFSGLSRSELSLWSLVNQILSHGTFAYTPSLGVILPAALGCLGLFQGSRWNHDCEWGEIYLISQLSPNWGSEREAICFKSQLIVDLNPGRLGFTASPHCLQDRQEKRVFGSMAAGGGWWVLLANQPQGLWQTSPITILCFPVTSPVAWMLKSHALLSRGKASCLD